MPIVKSVKKHCWPLLALALTWGLYFILFFSRSLEIKPDGLYAGHEYIWADWALHIDMIRIFAHKSPAEWFAVHPVFYGGKLTYPFLTNLVSGLLMRAGLPLTQAIILPSIGFSFLLLGGIYSLAYALLRSRAQSVAAVFLFLLSSATRHQEWSFLAGNVVVGLLVPQRAFLLGMALASIGLALTCRALARLEEGGDPKGVRAWLAGAGVLFGVLPITHMHSLFAITPFLVAVLVAYRSCWRRLVFLFLPAAAFAAACYFLFLRGNIASPDFMGWSPGWTSTGGVLGWMRMWWRIWGVALPLALLASAFFLACELSLHRKLLVLGFFVTFAAANLVRFQPIQWDNSKLFFWSYLVFCCAISRLFTTLWSSRQAAYMGLATGLALPLTIGGAKDTLDLQRVSQHQFRMISRADMDLGDKIREKTGSLDVFVAAPDSTSFVPMWAARPVLMTYPGWAWNFGFDWQTRKEEISRIYRGGNDAISLLKKHGVKYVVVGPGELREERANEAFFASRYPVAFHNLETRVYKVSAE